MKHPLLLATLLLSLSGCSHRNAPPDVEPVDPQAAWLLTHAEVIDLEAETFDDLDFLKPLLERKRVVQLGENAHGIREYNLAKARIVRFLHQELGFDVLVFESPLYQCYDADHTAADASARSTLANCAYGIWHTEEILPLFDYLRESRHDERPLRLAGIDIQPIGINKDDRPRFLSRMVSRVDAEYGDDVFRLDSTFLNVYARGGRERRTYFRSDDGRRMEEAYGRLGAFLSDSADAIRTAGDLPRDVVTDGDPNDVVADGHPRDVGVTRHGYEVSDTLGPSDVGVARRTALSMASYIRQQAAPTTREYVERRDQGMAENLTFLLDELYPDSKVIVWGHNFHLRHDNFSIPPDSSTFPDVAARTMGSWIHDRYGDQVYTVGLYTYRGTAADNGGEVYEIKPAGPGSVESILFEIAPDNDSGAVFVDLSRAPAGRETRWMDAPITARYNGTTPLTMVLRNQYDAILFVRDVTPRVMLY